MKIRELKLTNYRGVSSSLQLNFDEGITVFYGVNGAGKSTVLDAIAIMFSWAVSRIRHSNSPGRPIAESDITNGKSFSSLEMTCYSEGKQIRWKLTKNRKGHYPSEDKSDLTGLTDFTKGIQSMITGTEGKINIPIFVYYPVNRAVLDIPLRIRGKHQFDPIGAYDDALTSGADFRTFFEWFREREDLENENRKYETAFIKPDGFQYPDPQLVAVRDAIAQFLPEFSNLSVRRNPLRMEVEKNGSILTVSQLSDGEKCLMAMIGDLARRLAIANPLSANPLQGTAIVLIDEIDLHLHPKWQRMVITKLPHVFKNCQFIISTHSPHILTHVRSENLYLLTQSKAGIAAERPRESYGKNVDRVLEDLMGLETTRPDNVDADLHAMFLAINEGKLDEALNKIAALKQLIGDDPELVKAEVLIKRKEIIGK